jgi:hypothetical protein
MKRTDPKFANAEVSDSNNALFRWVVNDMSNCNAEGCWPKSTLEADMIVVNKTVDEPSGIHCHHLWAKSAEMISTLPPPLRVA